MTDDDTVDMRLPKPTTWFDMKGGRFIEAGDLKGHTVTYRITAVDREKLTGDKGVIAKNVITLKDRDGKPHEWVANSTNTQCLQGMFGGANPQDAIGKLVTLFPTTIESGQFKGKPCIRVWGSPDIAADMDVPVALPRKRPFKMMMRKVQQRVAGAPPAAEQKPAASTPPVKVWGGAPSLEDALAEIRGPWPSVHEFNMAKRALFTAYSGAGKEVPIEIEDAANLRREQLEEL